MATALKTRLLGSQSDERLSELASGGSQIAFEALARRYRRALLRRCRQLCLSQERAQDVMQRSLAEAWSGIQAGVEPQDPRSWLYGIAQRIATEQMRGVPGEPAAHAAPDGPDGALGAAVAEPELPGRGAAASVAPTPDEVLALRSALSAMTPRRAGDGIVVHRADGNNVAEDALGIADSAVRGLIGRVRRGISALTPPPLLGWALSRAAESGPSGERMAELGAGGAAGLTGLAVKGAVAALTAGVAITGAVVAQSGGHPHAGGSARPVAGARSPSSTSLAAGPAAGSGAGVGAGAADSGAGARAGGHHIPVASIAPPRHTSAPSGASTQGSAGSGSATDGAKPSSGQSPAGSQTREVRVQTSTSVTQTASASVGAAGGSSPSVSVESSSTGSTSQSGGGSAGIGVKVSLGGESGQQGGTAGGSGSSSGGGEPGSSSESSSTGIGISISLEPIASVGVHVSLP